MVAAGLVAGGDAATALRLGVSMTALQMSIGAANDLIDAPRDAGRVPPKPIPAGLVPASLARLVAVAAALVGLVLAVPSGPATLGIAVVVLGVGYAYDAVAKGTAWSWVPFAVGIPLLPVYGWLGAVGSLPSAFLVLVPVAVLAGGALAIGNAIVDVERDTEAGTVSVATAMGRGRAWGLGAVLTSAVPVLAVATLVASRPDPRWLAGALAGAVLVAAGLVLGRSATTATRERGWQLQAVGMGVLAAAWLAGFTGAG